MSDDNDDGQWAHRYLKNTIGDMLEGHGMDPETAVVTDVEYANGELAVRAVEQPAATDRAIAETKAMLKMVESEGTAFAEAVHNGARAAVFTEGGERVVESEGTDGEGDGSRPVSDREMARLVAARWLGRSGDD